MKKNTLTTLFLLLAAAISLAAPAAAQNPPKGAKRPMMDEETREKLERRVEQMIVWELSEVMQLSADKDEKFFTVMREHFRAKRELTAQQFSSMNALQQVYQNKSATDAELRKALDQLEAQFEKQLKLEMQLHKDLKKVLTAREQARFVIEWPRVQDKVREAVMQRKGGGPGMRGGMKEPK
jgi:Spy/CpxP family protein refolding chaperone